jgi:hypothetical protein
VGSIDRLNRSINRSINQSDAKEFSLSPSPPLSLFPLPSLLSRDIAGFDTVVGRCDLDRRHGGGNPLCLCCACRTKQCTKRVVGPFIHVVLPACLLACLLLIEVCARRRARERRAMARNEIYPPSTGRYWQHQHLSASNSKCSCHSIDPPSPPQPPVVCTQPNRPPVGDRARCVLPAFLNAPEARVHAGSRPLPAVVDTARVRLRLGRSEAQLEPRLPPRLARAFAAAPHRRRRTRAPRSVCLCTVWGGSMEF